MTQARNPNDYLIAMAMMQYQGSTSQQYLSGRKISDTSAEKFGLGHCGPNGIQGMPDAMKDRVVIPVISGSGRIVSFSGRDYLGRDKSLKCYKNYGFRKATALYGIHRAWRPIMECGYGIVVEGEFDCIKMHQIGFINTVSIMGSSLSYNQAAYLKMYCNKIFIFADNDETGRACYAEAAEVAKAFNITAHNMASVAYEDFEGTNIKDPDELIDSLSLSTDPFNYLRNKIKEAEKS